MWAYKVQNVQNELVQDCATRMVCPLKHSIYIHNLFVNRSRNQTVFMMPINKHILNVLNTFKTMEIKTMNYKKKIINININHQ